MESGPPFYFMFKSLCLPACPTCCVCIHSCRWFLGKRRRMHRGHRPLDVSIVRDRVYLLLFAIVCARLAGPPISSQPPASVGYPAIGEVGLEILVTVRDNTWTLGI